MIIQNNTVLLQFLLRTMMTIVSQKEEENIYSRCPPSHAGICYRMYLIFQNKN